MKCFVSVERNVSLGPCRMRCARRTVCHEAPKVASNNAVPGSALARIKLRMGLATRSKRGRVESDLFLDVLGDVLENH
jgi:hypothetical protein